MPFAPAQLVVQAVEALKGAHPLAVVTIPALLRAAKRTGVNPVTDGVPFGSTEETELLNDFFVLPRPPDPDRPFLAPWSDDPGWQTRKFPGGGLQRQRTHADGRGRILHQLKNDPAAGRARDVWKLLPSAGADVLALQPKPVRLVDLALWLGRNQDVPDLDGLLTWFNTEFDPATAGLVGSLYTDEIPADYQTVPFVAEPIGDSTAEELGSLPPAPTVDGTLASVVERLEAHLTAGGFQLPAGMVRRVLTAWLRGDMVVLVGQPGTGKTMFAGLLGRAMEEELELDPPLLIPIRSDFDEADLIGYERLDGQPQLREFATEVLQGDNPLEARVVVLEEFNLTLVESYLSPVLVASQEQERLVRLPTGISSQLPVDTFIIATCNSFRDEPETRTRVSSPTKRRSTIITMPNVLADRFDQDPQAVLDLVLQLINTERTRVETRAAAARPAQFDAIRQSALGSVTHLKDLSEEVRTAVTSVATALLTTSSGRSWFTLGLLRDVVLAIVQADRNPESELVALGQAVADKLVHQLRGSHSDAHDLREACATLPNADEIGHLLDRLMDGPSEELLPLL